MCGRRKLEKDHPELCDWGDMPFEMVDLIAKQVPPGTLVQFHNNGEPLLYPHLANALARFRHCIRQLNTNGKLLLEREDEIIDKLDVLTISVIQDDPEGEEQYEIVKRFVQAKRSKKPRMVYRMLGAVEEVERFYFLPGIVADRILHSPDGSFNYAKPVTIPETGI